jgi:hypothetical protein
MVWTKEKERPMRYLISVGRDRLRKKTLMDLWDICDREGSSMADEIWDALFTHVERYGVGTGGDGRVMMDEEPKPDFSMADDDGFDDVVANEAYEAQENVVEEIIDEESREPRRVASSNIFGNTRYE